jgi:hypothetical protein
LIYIGMIYKEKACLLLFSVGNLVFKNSPLYPTFHKTGE